MVNDTIASKCQAIVDVVEGEGGYEAFIVYSCLPGVQVLVTLARELNEEFDEREREEDHDMIKQITFQGFRCAVP